VRHDPQIATSGGPPLARAGAVENRKKVRTFVTVIEDPEIDWLRKEIDELDGQILRLIQKRLEHVLRVGDRKRERGLPVYDPKREQLLIERLLTNATEPLDAPLVREVFGALVRECRRIELEKH
jgi:chorismate mutase